MNNIWKMQLSMLVRKLSFFNKIESFDMGEQIDFCNRRINQMNIWKLQALLWVNKLNICNKIEIYPIFQKWGFCYGWTNWTFVTYELIRGIFENCKLPCAWTNCIFVTDEQIISIFHNTIFDMGEQIELL